MLFQPSEDDLKDGGVVGIGMNRRPSFHQTSNSANSCSFLKRFKVLVYITVFFMLYVLYQQIGLVGTISTATLPPVAEPESPVTIATTTKIDTTDNKVVDVIEQSKLSRMEEAMLAIQQENKRLKNLAANSLSPDYRERHRLYCMVPTIYQPHRYEKIAAVVKTWGKRCDVLKFFIDPPLEKGTEYPKYFEVAGFPRVEMVQVPIKRKNDVMKSDKKYPAKSCTHMGKKIACRHIWEKVWRSWVYIADHDLDKAEWFFKIDDDTFFFPEFLKVYLEKNHWNPEVTYYFGHVSRLAPTPFVNGAMVGLSKQSLRLVAESYRTMPSEYGPRENFKHHRCVDRDGASQEVTESICLHKLNISATTLVDKYGLQMISLFRLSDSIYLRKREGTKSWYWYKKPHTQLCCSETPVAFHWYKFPEDLIRIERYLYNESDTFLTDYLYSRPLIDALDEDPQKGHKAVISRVSKIPLHKFVAEIQYLYRVRRNIMTLKKK